MARTYHEFLQVGATIAAVVIDPSDQNAAMVSKLALPFPVLSDPNGERAIRPLGLWDESQKMSKPAIIALAPDGSETYRYAGSDFMDRPSDSEILASIAELALSPLDIPVTTIAHITPRSGRQATPLADLAIYMRGVRWASQALADRARDPLDRMEGERTSKMAERFISAQAETRRLLGK